MKKLLFPLLIIIASCSTPVFASSDVSGNSNSLPTLNDLASEKLMPALTNDSNLVNMSLKELMKYDYPERREQYKLYEMYTDAIYLSDGRLFSVDVKYDGSKYSSTLKQYDFDSKTWKEVVSSKDLIKIQYTAGIGWNKEPVLTDKGFLFITGTRGILIYNSSNGKISTIITKNRCYPEITRDHKLLILTSKGKVIIHDYIK